MRTHVCLIASCILFVATSARAQDGVAPPQIEARVVTEPAHRPPALIPLYVTLSALQVYDGYSTLHGVTHGASESNPLVGGLASNPAALWTLKVVSTAVPIAFAEHLWRKGHPAEAIVLLAVANGAIGVVAARNASIIHH